MNRFCSLRRIAPVALVLIALAAFPPFAAADPLIKIKGQGTLAIDDDGLAVLRLAGTASHLGKFACYGEIEFLPGEEDGALDGVGVVAFTAANGDLLVGVTAWHIDAGTCQAAFAWRDAVTFGDGTTVESTGRFVDRRPPGGLTIGAATLPGDPLGRITLGQSTAR